MPKLLHLLIRFPGRELAIHRLCVRNLEFRGLCEDYEEAVGALLHWETGECVDEAKAGDFRRLAAEIEADIRGYLDGTRRTREPDG